MCDINSTSSMTIEALPTELLTHILQYLSLIDRLNSEQVCKKWRDASRQTWRDIKTLYIIKPKPDICRHKFLKCTESHEVVERNGNHLLIDSDSPEIIRFTVSRVGCFLKKLVIDYYSSKNNQEILSIITSYCHNLEIFEFLMEDDDEDNEFYSRLFKGNKKLHSIKSTHATKFIEVVPLKNWKSLRLSPIRRVNEENVLSLIEHSENLEEFEIGTFTTRIVDALLNLRNLKSLYIRIEQGHSWNILSDVPLLNRLTHLSFGSLRVDTDMLCNSLQHCCQLKKLTINSVFEDFPEILLEAILALPVLESLDLQYHLIEDDKLIRLTKFRNLTLEELGGRPSTTSIILQMIKKSEVLENLVIERVMVTPELFKQLVKETRDRHKYLNIVVSSRVLGLVSEICAGSKIRVSRNKLYFKSLD